MKLSPNVPFTIARSFHAACRAGTVDAARECLRRLLARECGFEEHRLEDQLELLHDLFEARSTRGATLKQVRAIDRVCENPKAGFDVWRTLLVRLLTEWYVETADLDCDDRRRRCCGLSPRYASYIGSSSPSLP